MRGRSTDFVGRKGTLLFILFSALFYFTFNLILSVTNVQ
jgi:hypothetical protein